MANCCGRFLKYSLMVLNLLGACGALVFITLASKALSCQEEAEDTFGQMISDNILVFHTLIFGSIVFLLCLTGWLAAWREKSQLVRMHSRLLLTTLAAVFAVFLYTVRRPRPFLISQMLSMMNYYGKVGGVTKLWDDMQEEHACCGAVSVMDWTHVLRTSVPDSCCKEMVAGCASGEDYLERVNISGCVTFRLAHLDNWMFLMFGVAVLAALSLPLSCCLPRTLSGHCVLPNLEEMIGEVQDQIEEANQKRLKQMACTPGDQIKMACATGDQIMMAFATGDQIKMAAKDGKF